jgi:hypothetical protein
VRGTRISHTIAWNVGSPASPSSRPRNTSSTTDDGSGSAPNPTDTTALPASSTSSDATTPGVGRRRPTFRSGISSAVCTGRPVADVAHDRGPPPTNATRTAARRKNRKIGVHVVRPLLGSLYAKLGSAQSSQQVFGLGVNRTRHLPRPRGPVAISLARRPHRCASVPELHRIPLHPFQDATGSTSKANQRSPPPQSRGGRGPSQARHDLAPCREVDAVPGGVEVALGIPQVVFVFGLHGGGGVPGTTDDLYLAEG